jgi:hypothetical protein
LSDVTADCSVFSDCGVTALSCCKETLLLSIREEDGDCGCALGCSSAQELISKSIGSIKKQINFFIILFSSYNTDKASQDTLSFCFYSSSSAC